MYDAVQAARRISEYIGGATFDDYMKNAMMRAAVERELITIGEALNRLSDRAKAAHPKIAIPGIVGLRNRITHEYDRIQNEKIFQIATTNVPELFKDLTPLIPPIPPDPEPER